MAHVHFFLQGKGGVGKTTCDFYFTQQLIDSGYMVSTYDCDPVNWSLSNFKSINALRINLKSDSGSRVDAKKIPLIFNRIEEFCQKALEVSLSEIDEADRPKIEPEKATPEDIKNYTSNSHILFDVGASGFLPVSDFLKMGGAEAILAMGNKLYLHTIIAGDKMFDDCILCLETILKNFPSPDVKIVLWKNEFFGPLAIEMDKDQLKRNHYALDPESPTYKPLEKFDLYKENENRFFAILTVQQYDDDIIQSYIQRLLRGSLTFRSILNDKDNPSNFNLYEKMVVKKIRDQIYDQLAAVVY